MERKSESGRRQYKKKHHSPLRKEVFMPSAGPPGASVLWVACARTPNKACFSFQRRKKCYLRSVMIKIPMSTFSFAGTAVFDRLPRKMLTAWVNSPRVQGAPRLHYGSYITDCLERANLPLESWLPRAQLKSEWRASVNNITIAKPRIASNRKSSN